MRMPSVTASIASLRRSRASASGSPVAWVEVDEQISSTFAPTAWHSSSIDSATSILYSCRWPLRPSKVAQHLETGDAQAARLDHAHGVFHLFRMADQVARHQHDLRETRCLHGRQLLHWRAGQRDRVHAEVANRDWCPGSAEYGKRPPEGAQAGLGAARRPARPHPITPWWTRSNTAPPRWLCVSAPRVSGCTPCDSTKPTPRAQHGHAGQHIGRAQADTLQRFIALHIEDAGFGLDQLQVEAAARALQHAPPGQDAVALRVGSGLKPNSSP